MLASHACSVSRSLCEVTGRAWLRAGGFQNDGLNALYVERPSEAFRVNDRASPATFCEPNVLEGERSKFPARMVVCVR